MKGVVDGGHPGEAQLGQVAARRQARRLSDALKRLGLSKDPV
jgi:hypothetical protein